MTSIRFTPLRQGLYPFVKGVFLLVLFCTTPVFAANDPEIDVSQLLQDIILEDKDAGDRAQMVDKIVDGRGLFQASLAFETYNQAQMHATTIDKVFEHITSYMEYCPEGLLYTKENASINRDKEIYLHPDPKTKKPTQISLTKKDIVNIYTLSSPGMGVLGSLNNERVFSFEEVSETDQAYLESCKWVVGCQQGMQKINYDGSIIQEDEIPTTTTQERAMCEFIITDLFDLYSVQIQAGLNYDTNRDREIYYNNVLEEDRGQICDVNQELEKIGKMLSSTTQDLPKYSFYDPQSIKKNPLPGTPSSQKRQVQLPSEYETEEEDIPDESGFENSIQDIPYNGVPDQTLTREVTADYLGSTNNGKDTIGPSGAGGGNKDRLIAKPKEGGLSSLIKTPTSAGSDIIGGVGVIQNPQCEVSELGTADTQVDLLQESQNLTKTLQDYTQDLEKDERLSQALANEKLLTRDEQETHHSDDEPLIPVGDLQNDLQQYLDEMAKIDEDDVLSTMQQMENDIKACISVFTDEDPASRRSQMVRFLSGSAQVRECIQKVFCKEIVDPSGAGIYRVRFCSRIQKAVSTPTTKKVSSASDTLQALLAVVQSMTSSGRMVKHKQATEAMEGQIPKIQFKDIFSFGLNVVKNTPRTTSDPKVDKKQVQQTAQEIQQVTMNQFENLSVLTPFVDAAILYSETRVNAIQQDLQISTDFKGSLQQANTIIAQQERTSEDLHDQYRRMTNYEQVQHGYLIMTEHIDFWQDMLDLSEEMRSEIQRHYSIMKGR